MKGSKAMRQGMILILTIWIVFSVTACNISEDPGATFIPTPTPTPTPLILAGHDDLIPSRCEGLSGELEVKVLVGPAEIVGLEPFSVGFIPFTVVSDGSAYILHGAGTITYQDVLTEEWGTYTVSLNLDVEVHGECVGQEENEVLNITLAVDGEQMVEVRAEGFSGDYPHSGPFELMMSLPVMEGASSGTGEWTVVLHL
jgi:hypothetical protein